MAQAIPVYVPLCRCFCFLSSLRIFDGIDFPSSRNSTIWLVSYANPIPDLLRFILHRDAMHNGNCSQNSMEHLFSNFFLHCCHDGIVECITRLLCCKLVPVLIGGILIQGKRYGLLDLLAAILMSTGLILFTLADNKVSPNFDSRGYVMISLALVADAIIGNVQEKAMRTHNATNDEVVLYSYSIGSVYIFLGTLLSGQLFSAIPFFAEHRYETYGYNIIIGIVGYFGVNVVLTLVRLSGALIAVTVTTMRKAVTIIFSFYFFSKPFTMQYVWAGLIVLLAIYLNIYNKNKRHFDSKLAEWWTNLQNRDKRRMEEDAEKNMLIQV